MTYAEIQKMNQEARDIERREREAVKAIRGDSEARFFKLQEEETRKYDLGKGEYGDFIASVNPINNSVYVAHFSYAPTNFPAKIWIAFAELMVMFEDWKAGKVLHLPPSGTWAEAKDWLTKQVPPRDGVFR